MIRHLIILSATLLLGACGIDNDSTPRDIDPVKLESLTPNP
jgi:hypothetical protein